MSIKPTIGRVARQTGCKVQTIRYYEEIGLLPAPERSNGNQRLYTQAHVDRLLFIRHARELGFSIDAVRDLLALSDHPDRSCQQADLLARAQVADITSRIERLETLRRELNRMIAACAGDTVADCRILSALHDHRDCRGDDHIL